jgi:hypothetical protein
MGSDSFTGAFQLHAAGFAVIPSEAVLAGKAKGQDGESSA